MLSSESGKLEPDIVTSPFDVDLGITEKESAKILELKQNNESDELFKLLFIKQCNKLSEILPRLFEKTDDYTELLFNCSYVDQEGIVYRLTHDIPEEDFDINRGGQVEIIGWLYQYYNAELKDDTFALLKKNVKISKERIPSATQLFTPDWIVRYMVENSLGRLWTEGHVNTSLQLRDNWKYYLEEAEQEPEVQVQLNNIRKEYAKLRPEDIKLIDPCMGSGHILVYAFDVLMQIYESEGYSQRDAASQILEKNIWGLDIDDRAAQLAYFAVMMKARQYNRRILDGMHDCHILAIQESNGLSTLQTYMAPFGDLSDAALRLINSYIDAKEYGSILNIPLTLEEIDAIECRLEEIRNNRSDDVEELMVEAVLLNDFSPLLNQARIMVQKYDAVITNPPYMGSSNMNNNLSDYVKVYYPNTRSDLSTCFMEKCISLSNSRGYIAMINIPVWMFLSSYEKLRNAILSNNTYSSLLHFGRGVFGADFGSVAFTIAKKHMMKYLGTYLRLFDKQSSVDSIDLKEKWFLERKGLSITTQENYLEIPGCPVAYWVSDGLSSSFKKGIKIDKLGSARQGIIPGNVNVFLRTWYEVSVFKIGFNHSEFEDINRYGYKWFPYNKGGAFRRWYGNIDYVINMENEGYDIKYSGNNNNYRLREPELYFQEAVTWSKLTIGAFSARYMPAGTLFDIAGCCVFFLNDNLNYVLAFANSVVCTDILSIISPTLNYEVDHIKKLPVIIEQNYHTEIDMLVQQNIDISKEDWDSYETSWDFKRHPLI